MCIRRLLGSLGVIDNSKAAIVQHEFVDLTSRPGHTHTAKEIEQTLQLIESGQFDAMIEHAEPQSQATEPERYANLKPFNHEAWKKGHGSK